MKWISAICYPELRVGGFTNIDGTIAFYQRIRSLVGVTSIVVDFGCGRGAHADDAVAYRRNVRVLRGLCGRVIGLDVDQAGRTNPFIDEFGILPMEGGPWPIDSGTVDLVFSALRRNL